MREYKFLEEHTGLEGYTDKVHGEFDGQSKTLNWLKSGITQLRKPSRAKGSTQIVAKIACEVNWLKLWDIMLNEG